MAMPGGCRRATSRSCSSTRRVLHAAAPSTGRWRPVQARPDRRRHGSPVPRPVLRYCAMRRLPAAFQALLLMALPAAASGQVKASVETAGTVVLGEGPARTVRVEATYEEDLRAPRGGGRGAGR